MSIESIKQFLKPEWKKALIFIVFIILFLILPLGIEYNNNFCDTDPCPFGVGVHTLIYGFPLKYNSISAFFDINIDTLSLPFRVFDNINYTNLFVDLLFWYFISCLIIFAWDKVRNKKIAK